MWTRMEKVWVGKKCLGPKSTRKRFTRGQLTFRIWNSQFNHLSTFKKKIVTNNYTSHNWCAVNDATFSIPFTTQKNLKCHFRDAKFRVTKKFEMQIKVVVKSVQLWILKCICFGLSQEARGCYVYFIAKLTELLDTVFFVLRKKDNQVSFLHLYHHTVMPMISWGCTKYFPGGHGTFIGVINSFVHIVMYFYYMLAAMGPEFQKYLWWKHWITNLQMVRKIDACL